MKSIYSLLFYAFTCLSYAYACSKEEYLAQFGVQPTYTMADSVSIQQETYLVSTITYTTTCIDGGSSFEGVFVEKEDMQDTTVLFLKRSEPTCKSHVNEFQFTGIYAVNLDETKLQSFLDQPMSFLAMPPDSDYEIVLVQKSDVTIEGMKAIDRAMNTAPQEWECASVHGCNNESE